MVVYWSVRSKNFEKFCVVLSNTCIWTWLYTSSGSLQRWSSHVFRVFMLHLWGFLSKKTIQKSGVIVVCSELERIGNSLKIRKNDWLSEALESWKFRHFGSSLAHDKWYIFWLTSFERCIRTWISYVKRKLSAVIIFFFSFLYKNINIQYNTWN